MRPGLHFLVLGALLFAAQRLTAERGVPGPHVALDPAGAAAPSDEEILWREAVAMALDRNDPLVQRRLEQIGELVASGDVEDPAEFAREARRLGLAERDVVVRRHLATAMRLALAHGGPAEMPGEAEVGAYFARHRARWAQPARVRFRHVYFARDRAGVPAPAAAAAALATLGASPDAAARVRGDAFLDGAEIASSLPEIERRFGATFARGLAAAPAGAWSGPLRSSYGVHLVRVAERVPATSPSLDRVRARVVHALLAERAAARLERRLAARRVRLGAVEPPRAAW
jgi:hypothetical protein